MCTSAYSELEYPCPFTDDAALQNTIDAITTMSDAGVRQRVPKPPSKAVPSADNVPSEVQDTGRVLSILDIL